MAVLCTGSVAVDHIMVYRGRFKDVILPDRMHVLNVAFHVPELRRSFGGCAANIAYHLRLLGDDPLVLATVGGDDFDAYAAWLDRHGIRRDHIRRRSPARPPPAPTSRRTSTTTRSSASIRARWTARTRSGSSA